MSTDLDNFRDIPAGFMLLMIPIEELKPRRVTTRVRRVVLLMIPIEELKLKYRNTEHVKGNAFDDTY